MSKITSAVLETLLEEITDYEGVILSEDEFKALEEKCGEYEDRESIELIINSYLTELRYEYNHEECRWFKKSKKAGEIYNSVLNDVVFFGDK